MNTVDTRLLHLLRLVSPALPVGAFAYSQGMEAAVESQLIPDEQSTANWLSGLLRDSIGRLDMPVLIRQLQALTSTDDEQFTVWNARAFAYRETAELRLESQQMGQALVKLLDDMGESTLLGGGQPIDWVSAFALAAHRYQIDVDSALTGYAWSWCENQVAAAIKLVPLGQTAGQRVLCELIELIPEIIELAKTLKDEQIGSSATHVAILSSQHEIQYSRMFRS